MNTRWHTDDTMTDKIETPVPSPYPRARRSFIRHWRRLKEHPLGRLGPGLVTGVADDDPSGIATYSQAGAQFGLNMLWTMPLSYPLMAIMQSLCARLGRVTGKGLAANIKSAFSPFILFPVVFLLAAANVLNIAADIAAMGEVAELVVGLDRHLLTGIFVSGTLLLQVFLPYHRYVVVLKWLSLSLLAYVGVLFAVHVPWKDVAIRTFWPTLSLDARTATMVTGIFGTTISPYLFFWQASEEVEEMRRRANELAPLNEDSHSANSELRRIRWDTWAGMLYSNITAYFIILATALTLNVAGQTDIETAAEAAAALKPIAGEFAFVIFGLGILGVGLIGVPVLAGSAAYALSEAMGWKEGLERTPRDALGFYGVITVSTLSAVIIQFSPINPMKALLWSAVINGVVAVPLMALILVLCARRSVMGCYTADAMSLVIGWVATLVMGVSATAMFVL